jgi:hypothetical protein
VEDTANTYNKISDKGWSSTLGAAHMTNFTYKGHYKGFNLVEDWGQWSCPADEVMNRQVP